MWINMLNFWSVFKSTNTLFMETHVRGIVNVVAPPFQFHFISSFQGIIKCCWERRYCLKSKGANLHSYSRRVGRMEMVPYCHCNEIEIDKCENGKEFRDYVCKTNPRTSKTVLPVLAKNFILLLSLQKN